jgi:hypothetical protein
MTPEESREVGGPSPTIDKIEVGEFESQAAMKEWLEKRSPLFAQLPA